MRYLAPFVLFLLTSTAGWSDLRLADVFTDHAVLQRDQTVPVWGWAEPGEAVTVTFAGQTHATTATETGEWRVDLEPMAASAQGRPLQVAGAAQITRQDVLVGEVWLCSGQSNMEWSIAQSGNAEANIAAADFPLIRQFHVANAIAAFPAQRLEGGWTPCTPDSAGDFTAVGYHFARRLHAELGVPIGLINSTWGGTPVEAWLPRDSINDPVKSIPILRHQTHATTALLRGKQRHLERIRVWEAARDAAAEAGEAFTDEYPSPPWYPGPSRTATVLFNGMISPLLPYGLGGVIWYQGENNTGQPETYHAMFTELIEQWRLKFQQPDLPFYWAQLAPFDAGGGLSRDWAYLREAQHQTLALPHTGQAILMDIGEAFDIHPGNKHDVGDRLARIALAQKFGQDVAYRGPHYTAITLQGAEVIIHWANATGLTTRDGETPRGFELAGVDSEFHPASARIDGDQVILTSEMVSQPVLVRYAFRRWVDANLQNSEGLPAEPFRTDAN